MYKSSVFGGISKKTRGGIMCLKRFDLMQNITDINCENPDHITITFRAGHKIFSSYIPPVESLYYNDTCFTNIPNTFFNDDDSSVIIGGGDFNSRVRNLKQKLPVMDAKYRPNIDLEINTHGRM